MASWGLLLLPPLRLPFPSLPPPPFGRCTGPGRASIQHCGSWEVPDPQGQVRAPAVLPSHWGYYVCTSGSAVGCPTLTVRTEAAHSAGAGAAMLWVGAGPDAGHATLLVLLVCRARAQGCRDRVQGEGPCSSCPSCPKEVGRCPGAPPPPCPADSRHRPGARQRWTGWPIALHWRAYSDSVAQLQLGCPG